MTIQWPKAITPNVLADAIEDVNDLAQTNAAAIARNDARIAALETYAARIIEERTARIEQLEHVIAEHQAGAVHRQAELDQLRAQVERQAWRQRTGRKP